MRRLASLALLLPLLAAGCGDLGTVGPSPGDGDGDGDGDGGTGPADPLLCQATLSVTGTLAPSGITPVDGDPCIPFGTWTVDVTLADQADCASVEFDAQYVYVVSQDPDSGSYAYSYPADPNNPNIHLRVSAEGSACEGTFEHWSDDGKTLVLLKPFEDGLQLTGSGTFETYNVSQL
jgi:hypothetical protein